ncbi:class I SAM-dependent methyltransferase [Marivirga sp. S37H4]|uniref:Class I SAM-dependent methyltransferase n=1 Tax=Marivirga aurantiaca TaxID=2802615 RepID=A0A934X2M3_9BACT|nr:class I SAM-dependent methyltransferase [Marivirga aurantiaca]MBK6267151.1 class I SAM-dependent methyltransferase [Marivirga aurantiaca]
MYEKLTECPVCGGNNIENHKVVIDHSVSKESFVICICKGCQFQFTNPRPTEEEIGKYYQSDDYISHTNKGNSPINMLYKLARQFAIKSKYQLINNISKEKKGRILDFGCGTGYFLTTMKNKGWQIAGIEPNEQARAIAIEETKEEICADIKSLDIKNKKFNVITLWHVLEHIHHINDTIALLKTLLKEKGKIIIAVPNINSLDNAVYKEQWAAYDVPRHLYHFNPDSMKTLMLKHGLKVKNIYPMKLDAYYISLLSERYRTGNSNYLKSFINGYKSNSYAVNNNNNYSSLIYEIKK